MQKSPSTVSSRAIANSAPTSTMFIVRRPQPSATKSSSAGASTSAAVLPGSYPSRNAQKPSVLMRTESRTDSISASLFTARARSNSTSNDTNSALWLEFDPEVRRLEIAHGHHIVESVDPDAQRSQPVSDPLPRAVDEDLVLDPRRAVLADVARLCRKDDRRLALAGKQDVRVPVDDLKSREVGDRALEARVLRAGHDHGVDTGAVHRLAHSLVPMLDFLRAHACHDRSNPFTSAQIAAFRGVGTPCSVPKRTMPPFR